MPVSHSVSGTTFQVKERLKNQKNLTKNEKRIQNQKNSQEL
jgi:hypothetical protein